MTVEISWQLVSSMSSLAFPITGGISNIGGRLVTVIGGYASSGFTTPVTQEIWYSDDNGVTWSRGSYGTIFTRNGGPGSLPSDINSGLLCYTPGNWIHPQDGDYFSTGDGGGMLWYHSNSHVTPGTPIFLLTGYAIFGSPCLKGRKDINDPKFAIWPGTFLYEIFGSTASGPLLLELTASGATSLTTAYMTHQLDPSGTPMAQVNDDGSISWIWATFTPQVGSTGSSGTGLFNDGRFFFMLSTQDGIIWRPHGDNQSHIEDCRASTSGGNSYNYFTQAFFCSDGTLLCGVNVSGLSPCIFRSTADGMPGTLHEIVMPGNFMNYVPQGQKGAFLFSGLFVMTHCFCELADGTVLCGGGAPTLVTPSEGTGVPQGGQGTSQSQYHYPLVWKSTDKGLTWTNISLNVGDFGTRLALESTELWEGRILLSLGGQRALLVCLYEGEGLSITGGALTNDRTIFYVTEDGETFEESQPLTREGFLSGSSTNIYPIQATLANDGSILVVLTDWESRVEVWRGSLDSSEGHRALGFVEDKDSSLAQFSVSITARELIRG